jgi:hypothetical protein
MQNGPSIGRNRYKPRSDYCEICRARSRFDEDSRHKLVQRFPLSAMACPPETRGRDFGYRKLSGFDPQSGGRDGRLGSAVGDVQTFFHYSLGAHFQRLFHDAPKFREITFISIYLARTFSCFLAHLQDRAARRNPRAEATRPSFVVMTGSAGSFPPRQMAQLLPLAQTLVSIGCPTCFLSGTRSTRRFAHLNRLVCGAIVARTNKCRESRGPEPHRNIWVCGRSEPDYRGTGTARRKLSSAASAGPPAPKR